MHQILLDSSAVGCSEVAVVALRPVLLPDSIDVFFVCLGGVYLSVAYVGYETLSVKFVPAFLLLRRFFCLHLGRKYEESTASTWPRPGPRGRS